MRDSKEDLHANPEPLVPVQSMMRRIGVTLPQTLELDELELQRSDDHLVEGSSLREYKRRHSDSRVFGFSPGRRRISDEIVERERTKMMTDPDGNIYRGWAIGLHSGSRLLVMTLAVALLQVLAPLAILQATVPKLWNGSFSYVWTSTSLTDITDKVVGGLFLFVVFCNGDIILSRTDLQTDRLRDLYHKRLSKRWMFLDAFCNSWCIAVCAVATPCLLWTSDDTKYLVLDAFGVLFLHNLDDYSGDVEYGVETSEFDDLIDRRIREKSKQMKGRTLEARAEKWQSNWMDGCFIHGDICYSIARLINQLCGCFLGPAFALLKWTEKTDEESIAPSFRQVFYLQVFLVVTVFAYRWWLFCISDAPSMHVVQKDLVSFCAKVFFGRGDPRDPPEFV